MTPISSVASVQSARLICAFALALGAAAGASAQTTASPLVYPAKGQNAKQQKSVYDRANSACMEARGYVVK